MSPAELEEARTFAKELAVKRQQVSDGSLLDQCQEHLDRLLAHIDDANGEYPHLDEEAGRIKDVIVLAPEEEPPPKVTHIKDTPKKKTTHHKRPGH